MIPRLIERRIGALLLLGGAVCIPAQGQTTTIAALANLLFGCAPATLPQVVVQLPSGQRQCFKLDGTFVLNVGTNTITAVPGTGAVPLFSDAESPNGIANGTNPTFTLAFIPNPAASLVLVRNGLLQRAGTDYTLSGATITFVSGAIPETGAILTAWYRH